ncbi:MAG TPA: glycosyltransferase family A protein [Terriglobales bacterium]|nr:glycosyltransferase family A protein [Terriglobales bacterium]
MAGESRRQWQRRFRRDGNSEGAVGDFTPALEKGHWGHWRRWMESAKTMSIHNEPLVSVVTPVYNGASYLKECIESVLAQTYSNWEYIIVNNCSTDETLQIAEEYGRKEKRIQVHSNDRFLDVIANHNRAFRLISPHGKYCKQVSADDWLFPECLTHMVTLAETNPSVGIVGSYQLSGDVVKWQGFRYPRAVVPGREMGRRIFLARQVSVEGQPLLGFGTPTSLMYRADLVRSRAEFYPNSSPHADTSACFANLQNSDFGFVYEILSYERTHAESQTYASRQVNRHLSQTLSDLQLYGSSYLSKQEMERQLNETLTGYRRFLAVNYFVGFRDKEFWDYHKGRLAELGYPLSHLTLLKAAVLTVLQESVNPGEAIGKLWRHLFPARGEGAGETAQAGAAVKETLARG